MIASHIASSFERFLLPTPVVTVDAGATTIWLRGDQDLAVVDALRNALSDAMNSLSADRVLPIVVDLRGVTFMDTTTARALIDASRPRPGAPIAITLRSPSECVRRMFAICGRADLLDTA